MSSSYHRIVSLVPSLTELLFDLGLEERLVGRTRFCIRPEDRVDAIPIMGGTKNPRIDKIREARPDVVIANKEENRAEDIEALTEEADVIVTDIATVEDALLTIHELGHALGVTQRAKALTREILKNYEERPNADPLQAAYFIWRDPWMSVGHDTYIHDVMQHWNLTNAFSYTTRYPTVTPEDLQRVQPEVVLLSSEPFPFKEKHIEEVKNVCPDARVLLVDGQWFSWYGSRMKEAFRQLNTWRKAIA